MSVLFPKGLRTRDPEFLVGSCLLIRALTVYASQLATG